MIIKNGLVWEESGSFRKKELVVDTTTHRIAETQKTIRYLMPRGFM